MPSLTDDDLSYKVFVTTFLGYGANEAMARHRRSLLLSQLEKPKKIKLVFFSMNIISKVHIAKNLLFRCPFNFIRYLLHKIEKFLNFLNINFAEKFPDSLLTTG